MLRVKPQAEGQAPLPYGRQVIEDDDIAAVAAALQGDYLTTGPLTQRFETEFAKAVGAREAVVCANGTAALHLAARALGLGEGKTVIVSALTFLASANAMRLNGAEVLFADVNPDTGLMESAHLDAALAQLPEGKADGVVSVYLNGQCPDVPALASLARKRGLKIVEDAAHAVGTTYSDTAGVTYRVGAGAHADLTCFSFHPVKTIAMGEGGAITAYDRALARAMRKDRSHGMTRDAAEFVNPDSFDPAGAPNPWSYEMPEPGFNYRSSDIHCALGLSQLQKLDRFIARRRALVAEYDHWLTDFHPALKPLARTARCEPAWHLYVVLIDFEALGTDRAAIMRRLSAEGIHTQVHYYPVHRQPYYVARYGCAPLPGADAYYARALSLPLFPAMDARDVKRVVDALARAFKG